MTPVRVSTAVCCLFTVMLLAGCSGESRDTAEVDGLLPDLAVGGKRRESAAARLALILNRNPSAGASDSAIADRTVAALTGQLEPLVGGERPTCGSWADRPKYADLRFATELALHVAGNSGSKEAVRRGLRLRDLYLTAWAIRAAGAGETPVNSAVFDRVARNDYARSVLYEDSAVAERLPSSLTTLEARARADMTQWLAFPTELGCVPSDLELMKAIDRPEGRYFVFRFRAGGGEFDDANTFNAGISGPWDEHGERSDSGTFSDFQPARSATPEEHLDRIVGIQNEASG
jgi:hypothetical protein